MCLFVLFYYCFVDEVDDGIFCVVLIISGSVVSIKVFDIVGVLVKVNNNVFDILFFRGFFVDWFCCLYWLVVIEYWCVSGCD